jgi:hypothetical protein
MIAVECRMKTIIDVDQIRVASPCHARWQDMDGDERARFCRQCSKHVFNLSAMTRAQIETLVREKEGKFCGRFYRRADGRMLTADCPSRLRRLRERVAGGAGAALALLLTVLGCSPQSRHSNPGQPNSKPVMGDVLLPRAASTNSTKPELGVVVCHKPVADTNEPVVMGEIHIPDPTNRIAKPRP